MSTGGSFSLAESGLYFRDADTGTVVRGPGPGGPRANGGPWDGANFPT
ncbi:hypothetical protein ABZX75_30475 [Streptomyces sp. NPDC003038]